MQNEKANYSAFASFLSSVPDEIAIRRFTQLHIQNLLFYQAELVQLERELRGLEDIDAKLHTELEDRVNYRWQSPPPYPQPANNQSGGTASTGGAQQNLPGPASLLGDYQQKTLQIRETLRKYDEAVRDFAFMQSMNYPSRSNIRHIKGWLERAEFSKLFLLGSEQNVWDVASSTADFLAFTSNAGLSSALGKFLVTLQQLFTRHGANNRIYIVDSSAGSGISQGISVILGSVLPVLPIIVLFFIKSLLVRIGLVFVFTAVFAAVLVFGLNLNPDTVLAITTAIAAIQVVYVGSTGAQST